MNPPTPALEGRHVIARGVSPWWTGYLRTPKPCKGDITPASTFSTASGSMSPFQGWDALAATQSIPIA